VLAATVRVTRDLDLAEECVQDAYARALVAWQNIGVPDRPGAWLTVTSRRAALDVMRRDALFRKAIPELVMDETEPPADPAAGFPDDRLRLISTCCHPALAPEAQIALTLRLVCGLSTAEVARAFLVSESTMAARITRAKKKIAIARIPYRVPSVADLPTRMGTILATVHLIFTTGHTAPAGPDLVRADLVHRALDLTRMLRALLPEDADVAGLLALILLSDARRDARQDPETAELVLLEEQDRSKWDRAAIDEGDALVREALRARPPSRYALQAAIAAVHDAAPTWEATDWAQIVGLYDVLTQLDPSPVVALNRAVAVAMATEPAAGLALIDEILARGELTNYYLAHSARAELCRRLGRSEEARAAYQRALALTQLVPERRFLEGRIRMLDNPVA
jgi:RNA polymerase sigma-70 factor (ECF subfamily)